MAEKTVEAMLVELSFKGSLSLERSLKPGDGSPKDWTLTFTGVTEAGAELRVTVRKRALDTALGQMYDLVGSTFSLEKPGVPEWQPTVIQRFRDDETS